jgi:hypothetical protein
LPPVIRGHTFALYPVRASGNTSPDSLAAGF